MEELINGTDTHLQDAIPRSSSIQPRSRKLARTRRKPQTVIHTHWLAVFYRAVGCCFAFEPDGDSGSGKRSGRP
jgi:hypothetical protein